MIDAKLNGTLCSAIVAALHRWTTLTNFYYAIDDNDIMYNIH